MRPPMPPRSQPIMPPGGWMERYPGGKGTLLNPHTDTMDGSPPQGAAPSGPKLARPVSNAGTNGSNARYHVGPGSGLTRGERGWTDGVYWYDDNGLSLDRPDRFVPGLSAANESEGYDPWSGRSGGGGGGGGGGNPIAQAMGGASAGGGMTPNFSGDFLSGILSGGAGQQDAGGALLPPGFDQLPPQLLELIRSLMARPGMSQSGGAVL